MDTTFPDYDDLPSVEGISEPCAWGLFSRNGEKDLYGCLHKVTPDIIREATAEVEFNTQSHFHHQKSACVYNGSQPSIEDFTQARGTDAGKTLPTLDHWHTRGGLVARGVLIDYVSYAQRKGIQYTPISPHAIKVREIEEIAREQGVTFKQGDVIIIRTGYTDIVGAAEPEEQEAMINTGMSAGVEGSIDAVKWFWNTHCSAVASDSVGFEVLPATKDGVIGAGGSPDLVLHPHFLGLLGLHVGELWDLKALSEYCATKQRYTFLLTSIPLNIPGLVGSPPLRVIALGAGASGICLAKFLPEQLKNVQLAIYDKNPEYGGTWYENRYPGCACDIPSHIYQFSWAKNPNWSEYYAGAGEILQYFKDVVDRFDLAKYIHLSHQITGAYWNDSRGVWDIHVRNVGTGEVFISSAEIFINCSGILNAWNWPDIKGLSDFKGKLYHTADYDPEIDLEGKRVAVVGIGSSGVQVIPSILPQVSKLYAWIRQPTWMTAGFAQKFAGPNGDNFHYGAEQQEYFRTHPDEYLEYCKQLESEISRMFPLFLRGSPESAAAREPGNGFLEALTSPKVTTFLEPLQTVTENANGVNLQDIQAKRPTSYLAMAIPGMPNYFTVGGPYFSFGHGSYISMVELFMNNILQVVKKMQKEDIKSVTPKKEATDAFMEHADVWLKRTVWSESCTNWFKNSKADGVLTVFPGSRVVLADLLQTPLFEDYIFDYWSMNRFAFLGNGFSTLEHDGSDIAWYMGEKGKDGLLPEKVQVNGSAASPEWEDLAVKVAIPAFDPTDVNPEQLREATNALRLKLSAEGCASSGFGNDVQSRDYSITTRDHQNIIARVYRPKNQPPDLLLPVYLFFHGGGFLFGGVETEDDACYRIVSTFSAPGIIVVSINYRHTPEFKYPVPFNDAWDAFEWLAGLAASVALKAARLHKLNTKASPMMKISGQLLCIPWLIVDTDNYPWAHLPCSSYHQNADAPVLPMELLKLFSRLLDASNAPPDENKCISMAEEEDIKELPKTSFLICGRDVLRDEGIFYEERLRKNG
ncbi:unnamed protein product [Parascedosporium putredinis]|uniref:Alpha/beta hydrolase fold-3 domain-containing protein n=1 Tax=Parascedosporium putredinis TaxID=1442378 RepID=A0A9P1H5X0_9PEZI|nr:unnamed protein product [Parascedosporium putredinis]CAI7996829.1 unnamed protein product [Parascedosporium putredinis]